MQSEKEIKNLARKYGTPFYLFDTDRLIHRVRKIKQKLEGRAALCYAMKANPFLIQSLEDEIDCFEVCSPGEFHICERAAIPMQKVILSGVYKNEQDIRDTVAKYGASVTYTAESVAQWTYLDRAAKGKNCKVQVLLRLTNGSQFGMDKSELLKIIAERKNHPYVEIEGIHFFSGTQKKSIGRIQKELVMLDSFFKELKEKFDFSVQRLEYGPGLPVFYFQEEEDADEEILDSMRALLDEMEYDGKIVVEMGRYIAADCGSYVTAVADVKKNDGENYCIIDGGIHHINYFGQMLAMKKPPLFHLEEKAGEPELWTVCGSLCTTNDVLVKNYPFQNLSIGDFLVFQKTGAYSMTEGISLFLSRELPRVLLTSQKTGVVVARENFKTDQLNYFQIKK